MTYLCSVCFKVLKNKSDWCRPCSQALGLSKDSRTLEHLCTLVDRENILYWIERVEERQSLKIKDGLSSMKVVHKRARNFKRVLRAADEKKLFV